jgi:hypothetical protein
LLIALLGLILSSLDYIFKFLAPFILVLFALLLVSSLLAFLFLENNKIVKRNYTWEETDRDKTSYENDTLFQNDSTYIVEEYIIQHREWNDMGKNAYVADLKLKVSDLESSTAFKQNMYQSSWGNIYEQIGRFDSLNLHYIVDTFAYIRAKGNLSDLEFTNMVVSCIQNIPYTYVLEHESCYAKTQGLERPKCEEDQKFGINTPLEFIAKLKGDCDTRTLMLHTILKQFGYNVAIANSDLYRHSILMISLPNLSGDYLQHQGDYYYFWETTNVNWAPGVLPPENRNKDYWKIVLN